MDLRPRSTNVDDSCSQRAQLVSPAVEVLTAVDTAISNERPELQGEESTTGTLTPF